MPATRRSRLTVRRWWSQVARVGLAGVLLGAGCGSGAAPPDTRRVVLAEGRAGELAWRLEGQRTGGQLCTALVLVGLERPADSRCGLRRTVLRHLDAAAIAVGGRLLVLSAFPSRARRVRIDGGDGSLHVQAAEAAPGFPGRYFVVDLDQATIPVEVRVFGDGGRAIVT